MEPNNEINTNPSQDSKPSRSNTTTIIVSLIVLAIVALALYFGFYRQNQANVPNTLDINLNIPDEAPEMDQSLPIQ